MSEYLGCTDGGCIFGHPGGMQTNGGCHCLESMRDPNDRHRVRTLIYRMREKIRQLENELVLARAGGNAAGAVMLEVQQDCINAKKWEQRYRDTAADEQYKRKAAEAKVRELEEQLYRSATVCKKDGCMLWKGHEQTHASKDQVEEALAANSHPKRKRK